MADTIQIKRSSTPLAVPSGLAPGELAVNLADHRLFIGGGAEGGYALSGGSGGGSGTVYTNSGALSSGGTLVVPHADDAQLTRAITLAEQVTVPAADAIPTMTGQTTSGCTITASSYWQAGYEPWRVGNNVTSDYWAVASASVIGAWLKVAFSTATPVAQYSIRPRSDYNNIGPKSWQLAGSDDGVTWTVLDTRTAYPINGGQRAVFDLSASVSYSMYRLTVLEAWDLGYTVPVCLAEFELLGPPDVYWKLAPPADYEVRLDVNQTRIKRLAAGDAQVHAVVRI